MAAPPDKRRNSAEPSAPSDRSQKAYRANPPDPTDPTAKHHPQRLRPSGGYRKLRRFQTATLIYDGTVSFCKRFVDPRSRTHDQMVVEKGGYREQLTATRLAEREKEGWKHRTYRAYQTGRAYQTDSSARSDNPSD